MLSTSEKAAVVDGIKKAYPHVTSIAAYGSRIMGYARQDSDYDVLAILPGFKGGIRYRYLKGELPIAILVSSKSALFSDARYGLLGEFLAGRLLLPIEVLEEDGSLRDAAQTYRSKVFFEGLLDISQYGPIAHQVMMPPEYPAFLRMHLRMKRYPPLEYSYAMTLEPDRYAQNVERIRECYRPVAERALAEGMIDKVDGMYSIEEEVTTKSLLRTLTRILADMTRVVGSYLTHTYAGIFEVQNIFDEVKSKVRRSEMVKPQEFLKNPRLLLSLPEGTLSFGQWEKKLLSDLGWGAIERRVIRRHVTDTIYVQEYSDGRRRARYVVKGYSSLASMKWTVLAATFTPVVSFKPSSAERMSSEYRFHRLLRDSTGIYTPRIILVDLKDNVIVKEFIEGSSLDRMITDWYDRGISHSEIIRCVGTGLGKAHANGIALCDTKPSNFLWRDGKLWVVDLEQARLGTAEEFAWDVSEFIYYSAINRTDLNRLSGVARAFLAGYVEEGPRGILSIAARKKCLLPFTMFVLPNVLLGLNNVIKEQAIS